MTRNIKMVLERENLLDLMPLFDAEKIVDEVVDTLTESDLERIGVSKLGDRRRILIGFSEVCGGVFGLNSVAIVGEGLLPPESTFAGKKVETFHIGKYPITTFEWEKVRMWGLANGFKLEAGEGRGSRHPITLVSWYDAVKWCNAKSKMEGLTAPYSINGKVYTNGEYGSEGCTLIDWDRAANGWRLPTEIEWEWAARGGALSQGFRFSGSDDVNVVGWHEQNSDGAPHPVGLKKANELGIYDMSGNVWEWCWDKEESLSACRIRGGSWMELDGKGTVSYRVSRSPETRYTVIGFRVARNV
jgi:formylglycine-generating enzyme required for sulfatase activity